VGIPAVSPSRRQDRQNAFDRPCVFSDICGSSVLRCLRGAVCAVAENCSPLILERSYSRSRRQPFPAPTIVLASVTQLYERLRQQPLWLDLPYPLAPRPHVRFSEMSCTTQTTLLPQCNDLRRGGAGRWALNAATSTFSLIACTASPGRLLCLIATTPLTSH
jgi:hypothetical protein